MQLHSQVNSITWMPETNLRRWQKMLQRDPMWHPWQAYAGRQKRIFWKDAALATFVRDNCITTGLILPDSDFCEIAMNAFLSKHRDSSAEIPMLQCSARIIANFPSTVGHPSQEPTSDMTGYNSGASAKCAIEPYRQLPRGILASSSK
jgi:hypothetical protein